MHRGARRASRSRWSTPPSSATATRSSTPGTLVLVISQSGETADTLAAMREAQQQGRARRSASCNVVGSTIARESRRRRLHPRRPGDRRRLHQGLHLPGGGARHARPCCSAACATMSREDRAAASSRELRRIPEQDRARSWSQRRRDPGDRRGLRAPQQLPLPRPRRTTSRWRSRARSSSRRSPTSTPRATRRPR